MRIIIPALAFMFFTLRASSQNAGVEKSLFGIQTGFLGIWGYNEMKLSNKIALRSEIGFDGGIWGGYFYEKTGFFMTPVITAEPRWYYNLNKRAHKSKRTDRNSGNFISLKTSYHPSGLAISNYEDVEIISDISMIPTWGIRRNMGKKFNFETGIGLGFGYAFAKEAGYAENEFEPVANLHLRIGYGF